MLQESCAISYMLEMLGSTMKENLIHQILSLVQLNQLLFHSCKIWVLNYLIIGWKLSDWQQYYQKKHTSIHLDDFHHRSAQT